MIAIGHETGYTKIIMKGGESGMPDRRLWGAFLGDLCMFRKFLVFTMLIGFATLAFGHERSWPGRRLYKLWPQVKFFVRVQKSLTPDQVERIERLLGKKLPAEDRSPIFYYAYADKEKKDLLGVVLFVDSTGKNGPIELSFGFDQTTKLQVVDIWQHQENDYIRSKEFLGYFIGKTVTDNLVEGTFSKTPLPSETVHAFITAVRRAQDITLEAFGRRSDRATGVSQ